MNQKNNWNLISFLIRMLQGVPDRLRGGAAGNIRRSALCDIWHLQAGDGISGRTVPHL